MHRKVTALIIAIFAAVVCFTACGAVVNSEKETAYSAPPSDDPAIQEIDTFAADLASGSDFKGKTFTWIGEGAETPKEDEETGDLQSDALYYRQREIEMLFSISWENCRPAVVEGSDNTATVDVVVEDVLAGMGNYNAGYGMEWAVTEPLLSQGMLSDFYEIADFDFDRFWWPDSLLDSYTIGSALYLLNGPIVSFHYQDAACVIFNKKIAEDYGVEAPYQIVKDGEWTFDKMFELAEKVPANISGAGVYRFGNPDGVGAILANGMTVTKFDGYGNPYVEDFLSDELATLGSKLSVLLGDESLTANCKQVGGNHESWSDKYGYKGYDKMFADDRVLFMFIPIDEASWLRIEEVKFGILPMPKRDTSQENYISYADRASTHEVFVPKSVADTDFTCTILEAMAALGVKHFKPVYYDNILKSRSTYDYDSQDMVDIIFSTKKYDMIGLLDGEGSYIRLLDTTVAGSVDGVSSRYLMHGRTVNNHIKQLLEDIEKSH